MKLIVVIFFYLTYSVDLIAQNEEQWQLNPVSERVVKSGALSQLHSLSDLIAGYPSQWIDNYVSVEIQKLENRLNTRSLGKQEVFTNDQKKLLEDTSIGTSIKVTVRYQNEHTFLNTMVDRELSYIIKVVPEVEATFAGDLVEIVNSAMSEKKRSFNSEEMNDLRVGRVNFTIDKSGMVVDVIIKTSTGDRAIDQLLIKSLSAMPRWSPALDAHGQAVAQDFEYDISWPGLRGC